jgi:uroporphyrinogen-III decarboxylase
MVNMTGIYITSISGMLEVFGWEMLLLAAGTDLAEFGELTERYAAWVMPFFEALAETDVPVVMIHDDIVWSSGPIFSPRYYRSFIFPNYKKFFAPLRDSGKKIMFTSDGNYTQFIDDIANCGVHGFIMEPTTDMAYIAEKYGKTHVFIGNADTRVLLSGSRAEIRAEVERCMKIGKACPGFFLATGNHIPSNTPVENVLYYFEVYEALSKR